jgi:2,4'-dihydroxyacetophenone dioxygenase
MMDPNKVHIKTPMGEVLVRMSDLDSGKWIIFPDLALRQYFLWMNPQTGASIAIIEFEKGAGIPTKHTHASNQFMYCIEGEYEYTDSKIVLRPGDFYMNPKDNPHGPTVARHKSILIEIYDGPHYYEKPSYHSDDTIPERALKPLP